MRLFERAILPRFTAYLSPLLHPLQAGFRKRHSTSDNLYRLVDRIYSECNRTTTSRTTLLPAVFLDLKKAFDKMDPVYLLYKLHCHMRIGVHSKTLRFVGAFLENRRLRVSLNGTASTWLSINCSTPQGSVLGPVLFLIYINDLLQAIRPFSLPSFPPIDRIPELSTSTTDPQLDPLTSSISPPDPKCPIEGHGYADDIVLIPADFCGLTDAQPGILRPGTLTSDLQRRTIALQRALLVCSIWARDSLMTFSLDKTNSLLFHTGRSHSSLLTPERLSYLDQLYLRNYHPDGGYFDTRLTRATEYSYMGITFSHTIEDLFTIHGEKVLAKLIQAATPLRRLLSDSTPLHMAIQLFRSLYLPVVYYGLEFIRYSSSTIKRLEAHISSVARDVLHVPHHVRRTDLFLALAIPPLRLQHEYQLLTFINRIYDYPPHRLIRQVFLDDLRWGRSTNIRTQPAYYSMPIGQELLIMSGQSVIRDRSGHPVSHSLRPYYWPPSSGPGELVKFPPPRNHSPLSRSTLLRYRTLGIVRLCNSSSGTRPLSALQTYLYLGPITSANDIRSWINVQKQLRPSNISSRLRLAPPAPNQNSLIRYMQPPAGALIPARQPQRRAIQPLDDHQLNLQLLIAQPPELPVTSLNKDAFSSLDSGPISRLRMALRLDKLPTQVNKEYYWTRLFQPLGITTHCRACGHYPPRYGRSRPLETQSHILFHCSHPFASALRVRLISALRRYNLSLDLHVLAGSLSHLHLPKALIGPVLSLTGQYLTSITHFFRIPIRKTSWKYFFSNHNYYLQSIHNDPENLQLL